MFRMQFQNVLLDSYALALPEREVSSAAIEERIGDLYRKLRIPFGTLEKLSGVKNRRVWDPELPPSQFATEAAKEALQKSDIDPSRIGAIVSCSVTRDYFEPAVSALVHSNLGFKEQTLAFDITNACIGFSNGIQMVSMMIEQGIIEAGLVVSGENISRIIESSIELIQSDPDLPRDEMLRLVPTFTLGCGAAAAVVCHEKLSSQGHRLIGCTARSATQHNGLCQGNGDFYMQQKYGLNPIMHTESHGLINAAAELGGRMWEDFSRAFRWERNQVDHVFVHNVGKQVNRQFYDTMGLDFEKDFCTYPRYGNMVSASLPGAFFTGVEEKPVRSGDKVLCAAFGSGLNSIFLGFEW